MLLRRAFDATGTHGVVYVLESATGIAGKAEEAGEGGRSALDALRFDNSALRDLPVDRSERKGTRQVEGACFSKVAPTPVEEPVLVAAAPRALSLVDIHPGEVSKPDFVRYFSGNQVLPRAEPAAHCYCGHQFGNFAGQLGDGATMYLGEVVNAHGERWELQFKGAGLTPFSRQADGRKVLRSSLREFLCSEAMHGLGVPTTRAGTLVTSSTRILRDPLYDGRPVRERASVITRIARSFLRVGSFEIAKPRDPRTGRYGPSFALADKGRGVLTSLLRFAFRQFPELPTTAAAAREAGFQLAPAREGVEEGDAVRASVLFAEVCRRTAQLAAMWQAVGWCHGVLNTDNISVTGVTLDYGPFGFLDRFDHDHVCNGSDDGGRYSYRNQAAMCRWDMRKFAEALSLIVDGTHLVRWALPTFDSHYRDAYLALFRAKLGLLRIRHRGDGPLVASLLDTMHATGADFTNTFRLLAAVPLPRPGQPPADPSPALVAAFVGMCAPLEQQVAANKPPYTDQQFEIIARLEAQGPMALIYSGLSAGSMARARAMRDRHVRLGALSPPEFERELRQAWHGWLSEYIARLAQEAAGSPEGAEEGGGGNGEAAGAADPPAPAEEDPATPFGTADADSLRLRAPPADDPAPRAVPPLADEAGWRVAARARVDAMLGANPKRVLRNYVAEELIRAAEGGDYGPTRSALQRFYDPYEATEGAVAAALACAEAEAPVVAAAGAGARVPGERAVAAAREALCEPLPPSWAATLCVTCSS